MKKGKKKRIVLNFLLLVGLSLAMFLIIYKKADPEDLMGVFLSMDKKYLAYAFIAFILFRLMEAIVLNLLLKNVGEETSLRACMDYSILGYFFTHLTPSGGGGQPAQLYLMNKDKVPNNKSLSTIVSFNILYHVSLSILGILSLTTSLRPIILEGRLKGWYFLGILVQVGLALGVVFLSMKSEGVVKFLIFLSKKAKKVKFLRGFSRSPSYIRKFVKDLRDNIKVLTKRKLFLILILSLQILMVFFLYSIAYFTYRALGFSDYGIMDIVRIQCLVIIATDYIPTPGTAGFAEFALFEVYKEIIDTDYALSWMMTNRLILVYLSLIFAIIMLVFRKKGRRRHR